jgi:hypothetical protein
MSKPLIEITLDRADRTYAPGEEISGTVRWQVDREYECQALNLRYEWRTHGRGNPESGGRGDMVLASGDQWRPGATYSFPFKFKAPSGPATYHGHYLNVDWYVTARASLSTSGRVRHWRKEAEFLLRSDAKLKVRSTLFTGPKGCVLPVVTALTATILAVAGFGLMSAPLYVPSAVSWGDAMILGLCPASLGLIILAVGASLARQRIFAATKLGRVIVQIEPSRMGDWSQVSIRFSPRSEVRLERISVQLLAVEETITGSGSTRELHARTVFSGRSVKPYSQGIEAGEDFLKELALDISPELPVTFTAPSNEIKWTMTIQIDLKGWPNWTLQTPITVYR